jgi:lipoprotein-anchoring transpeptidase ErfK/SrfK
MTFQDDNQSTDGARKGRTERDYYIILSRAVAELVPNTVGSRAALFDRARKVIRDEMRLNRHRWTDTEIVAEGDNFENAVARIEAEMVRRPTRSPVGRQESTPPTGGQQVISPAGRPQQRAASEQDDPVHTPRDHALAPAKSSSRLVLWSSLAGLALVLIGLTAYLLQNERPTLVKSDSSAQQKVAQQPVARSERLRIDDEELPPGVDGGSTDAGLPFFFRRQAVYYRTVYSEGMVVVDRSQRFLYLVQPQIRALRYGIGVGGECVGGAGMQRILRLTEWPEWVPSPDLRKLRSYPERLAGGPGNPLGARALYLDNGSLGVHGTNAPKSIGNAMTLGCFRMVNDDVVDLAKRVAIGAGVVVMN